MSKPSHNMSPEDIKRLVAERRAAAKRVREALAELRVQASKVAPETESLEKLYDSLAPSSREWIDQAVRVGMQRVNRILSGAPKEAASQPSRPRKLRSKEVGVAVPSGSVIHVLSGGGGGWGPPEQRDPAAREQDAAEGLTKDGGKL